MTRSVAGQKIVYNPTVRKYSLPLSSQVKLSSNDALEVSADQNNPNKTDSRLGLNFDYKEGPIFRENLNGKEGELAFT